MQAPVPQAADGRLHILLPTLGSAGDVYPMLALGAELQRRGHRATLVSNELFAGAVRSAGLDFIPLGTAAEAQDTIRDPRLWHPVKAFECIAERVLLPNLSRLFDIIARQSSGNLVVAAPGTCLGARVAQEKLETRLATVHLQPAMIRSLCDSGMQGRIRMGPGIPRLVKRAAFRLMDALFVDRYLLTGLNAFRKKVGLRPVDNVFADYVHSKQLVICLFPDWFAPVQPDWPPHLHAVGFVFHEASAAQDVTERAEEFLASGPPPIVVTPGSATDGQARYFAESIEACRIAGVRAILVTSFPDQLPATLPTFVTSFSYLPFSRILPRCAGLVYYGGIGTMARAIQAGIPHLVVPHAHDQPDNAWRIERLGLGRRLYPERYRAPKAARLLRELLASSQVRDACQRYAGMIDPHAALQRACELIEQLGFQQRESDVDGQPLPARNTTLS